MSANKLPIRYDIDGDNAVYRGDIYHRLFRPWYRQPDGTAAILATTGWTARMQVRTGKAEDSPVVLEVSTANGRIVTGQQDDPTLPYSVGLFLTHEDTGGLPPGFMGYYDLELTDTAGLRQTYYHGVFHVEGDVTR